MIRCPKILIVVRWPVGGIRTWFRDVYSDRRFASYDMEVLLPDFDESRMLAEDLRFSDLSFGFVSAEAAPKGLFLETSKRLLQSRYSFLHAHGFTSAIAALLPTVVARTPLLVTPHDLVLEDQYRDLKGRLGRAVIALSLKQADCVQCVSGSAASGLVAAFPSVFVGNREPVVIRNGVSPGRLTNARTAPLRERYGISKNAIIVGFFGRFMGQKGFRYLREAMWLNRQRLGNSEEIVVVAVGSGAFRGQEEAEIRSMGLESSFRFVDLVPDLGVMLKSVDVVAMPSLWEACGLLAMEALIAGTPIVVSNCHGLLEVTADTPAIVVPMKDAAALLQGILEANTPQRRMASIAFREEAARRFDVAMTIEGVLKLYQRLAGPRHDAG